MRNRVSYTTITDTGTISAFNQGTFYTYDILGNVDQLLQDYGHEGYKPNVMNKLGNRWKKIVYKYDLISGKVNMVMYQHEWDDNFFHRYSYDAENRLILVETSRDSLVWEKDGRYEYYRHGPLARITLGDQQVQGIDYAYTLQGWLKGINSTGGTDSFEMGGDGRVSSVNRYTARDAYGIALNYYANDYTPIGTVDAPFPNYSAFLTDFRPLYNRNISSNSIYQKKFDYDGSPGGPLIFYNYHYDQLNRLTGQDAYNGFNKTANDWTGQKSMSDTLKERVAYDGNGNILKYLRKSIDGGHMDSLNYFYYTGTNKLKRVTDSVPPNTYTSQQDNLILDVDSQPDKNYCYDAIGNLIKDSLEQITSIKWNVYGKIQEIDRVATAEVPVTNIKYSYDALGKRISQVITTNDNNKYYTWFVRDGHGNIMSTYTAEGDDEDDLHLKHSENLIYGSSRLGTVLVGDEVNDGPGSMQYYRGIKGYGRGYKQYELTNHLGNVLATISDKKYGVPLTGSSSIISYYESDIVTAQDYYPFGMMSRVALPNSGVPYKFGFNGKWNDNEAKGLGLQQDYGERIYDPRVARFYSVDPLSVGYPELTPYQFASNTPVQSSDIDGLEGFWEVGTMGSRSNTILRNQTVRHIGSSLRNSLRPISQVVRGWGRLSPRVQRLLERAYIGREEHAAWRQIQNGQGWQTEVPISGGRIDAFRLVQRAGKIIGELKDLKPNNPEAIAKGFEQMERYAQVLSKMSQYKGVTEFVGMVETYSVVGTVLTQNLSFTYTVQKDDNLTTISNKFGVSVDELKKMNGNNDKVQAGNKVVVGNVSTSLDMEDKEQHQKDVKEYKRYINSGEHMLDQQTQKDQFKKVN